MNDAKLGEWLRKELPLARQDSQGCGMTYTTECGLFDAINALVALLRETKVYTSGLVAEALERREEERPFIIEAQSVLVRLRAVLEAAVEAEMAKPCCWQLPPEGQ